MDKYLLVYRRGEYRSIPAEKKQSFLDKGYVLTDDKGNPVKPVSDDGAKRIKALEAEILKNDKKIAALEAKLEKAGG